MKALKLLLATGQIDVSSKDKDGQTPLLYAAECEYEGVVKLLLGMDKVDADSRITSIARRHRGRSRRAMKM